MHRRSLIALTCAFVLSLGLVGQAAASDITKGEIEISPTVGFTLPFGDLGDAANAGPAFGVQGIYYLNSKTGIGGGVVYNALGSDLDGFDISITEILVLGKRFFSDSGKLAVYGKGAAGFFSNSFSYKDEFFGTGFSGSTSETDFGIGAGAGVQSRQSAKWGWFGEGMLMLDNFDDMYLALRVGANLYFGGDQQ